MRTLLGEERCRLSFNRNALRKRFVYSGERMTERLSLHNPVPCLGRARCIEPDRTNHG